jgi:hypothetical protein
MTGGQVELSIRGLSFQKNRQWTVVLNFNYHMGAELTFPYNKVIFSQFLDEDVQQMPGKLRGSSLCEAWPAAFAGVCIERELRDDQHFTIDLANSEIRLPLSVLENPQRGYLLSQPFSLLRQVSVANAQQNHQPWANRANLLAGNGYPAASCPL